MPTTRLYYEDSYLRTFQATLVARSLIADKTALALDQSAFYPEGGGQPADTGTIAGVAVLDVQADAEGIVWHVMEEHAAININASVNGEIGWARRFDHMQQHHGQHLLSAAFEQLYGMRTIAFHLGTQAVTIDLDTASITPAQICAVEDLTNEVIWQNRPIHARFVSDAELATITLRKAPTVAGPIRVVSVPDFDHSACGGTHPSHTGAVGMLHIRRSERRANTTRVEFACGGRTMHDLRRKHTSMQRIAQSLSIGMDELEGAINRLREQEEHSRKTIELLQEQLIPYEAQGYFAQALSIGTVRVVATQITPRRVEAMRALASQVADLGCIAIIGMASDKGHLIVARAEGIELDSGALVKAALAPYGGKGGGRPELAQGGVADASSMAAIIDQALNQLR
jgi:alanyl-tRNA synthetase